MEIQNSTNDDAMIKVEGGPSGTIKGGPTKPVEWQLGPGQTLKLSIAVSRKELKSLSIKGLKLTKGTNGYDFKVVKGGRT